MARGNFSCENVQSLSQALVEIQILVSRNAQLEKLNQSLQQQLKSSEECLQAINITEIKQQAADAVADEQRRCVELSAEVDQLHLDLGRERRLAAEAAAKMADDRRESYAAHVAEIQSLMAESKDKERQAQQRVLATQAQAAFDTNALSSSEQKVLQELQESKAKLCEQAGVLRAAEAENKELREHIGWQQSMRGACCVCQGLQQSRPSTSGILPQLALRGDEQGLQQTKTTAATVLPHLVDTVSCPSTAASANTFAGSSPPASARQKSSSPDPYAVQHMFSRSTSVSEHSGFRRSSESSKRTCTDESPGSAVRESKSPADVPASPARSATATAASTCPADANKTCLPPVAGSACRNSSPGDPNKVSPAPLSSAPALSAQSMTSPVSLGCSGASKEEKLVPSPTTAQALPGAKEVEKPVPTLAPSAFSSCAPPTTARTLPERKELEKLPQPQTLAPLAPPITSGASPDCSGRKEVEKPTPTPLETAPAPLAPLKTTRALPGRSGREEVEKPMAATLPSAPASVASPMPTNRALLGHSGPDEVDKLSPNFSSSALAPLASPTKALASPSHSGTREAEKPAQGFLQSAPAPLAPPITSQALLGRSGPDEVEKPTPALSSTAPAPLTSPMRAPAGNGPSEVEKAGESSSSVFAPIAPPMTEPTTPPRRQALKATPNVTSEGTGSGAGNTRSTASLGGSAELSPFKASAEGSPFGALSFSAEFSPFSASAEHSPVMSAPSAPLAPSAGTGLHQQQQASADRSPGAENPSKLRDLSPRPPPLALSKAGIASPGAAPAEAAPHPEVEKDPSVVSDASDLDAGMLGAIKANHDCEPTALIASRRMSCTSPQTVGRRKSRASVTSPTSPRTPRTPGGTSTARRYSVRLGEKADEDRRFSVVLQREARTMDLASPEFQDSDSEESTSPRSPPSGNARKSYSGWSESKRESRRGSRESRRGSGKRSSKGESARAWEQAEKFDAEAAELAIILLQNENRPDNVESQVRGEQLLETVQHRRSFLAACEEQEVNDPMSPIKDLRRKFNIQRKKTETMFVHHYRPEPPDIPLPPPPVKKQGRLRLSVSCHPSGEDGGEWNLSPSIVARRQMNSGFNAPGPRRPLSSAVVASIGWN